MTIHTPPFQDEDLYSPSDLDTYRRPRPPLSDLEVNSNITDVLVVEDSPSCIESIEQALRSVLDIESFHVTQDWESTVSALRTNDYDLIMLDKNLPETRGGATMNAYKQTDTIQNLQDAIIIGTSSEGHAPPKAAATVDKVTDTCQDLHEALKDHQM